MSSTEKYLHRGSFCTYLFVAGTAGNIFTGEVSYISACPYKKLHIHNAPLSPSPCHSPPTILTPYHLSYPLLGHVPFHAIAKLSTVHRKRRDVEAEGNSNKLAFSLRLSNVTHSFTMLHGADLLSPHYVLEEVKEDGRLVTIPSSVKDCYYIQEIKPTGLSAVTVCSHTVVSSMYTIHSLLYTHTVLYLVSIVQYILFSLSSSRSRYI